FSLGASNQFSVLSATGTVTITAAPSNVDRFSMVSTGTPGGAPLTIRNAVGVGVTDLKVTAAVDHIWKLLADTDTVVSATYGFLNEPIFSTVNGGTLNVLDEVGFLDDPDHQSSGVHVTNRDGYRFTDFAGSGVCTKQSAFRVGNLANCATSMSFQSQGNQTFRHDGNMRLGDTTVAPTHKLEVVGTSQLDGLVTLRPSITGVLPTGTTTLAVYDQAFTNNATNQIFRFYDISPTATMSYSAPTVAGYYFGGTWTNTVTPSSLTYNVPGFKAAPVFQ